MKNFNKSRENPFTVLHGYQKGYCFFGVQGLDVCVISHTYIPYLTNFNVCCIAKILALSSNIRMRRYVIMFFYIEFVRSRAGQQCK